MDEQREFHPHKHVRRAFAIVTSVFYNAKPIMIARLRLEKLEFQHVRLTALFATTLLFAVAIAPSATGSSDYAPAVDKILTCSKYYTSGYGKKFVVIHDMEGYYASGISYLRRCDLNASGGYNVA